MKSTIDYIKGSFSVCGVIGDPIEHTLSPFIHNTINTFCEQESIYVPYHVENNRLQQVVEGAYALGVRGLNVTMPFKQEIIPYLVEVDEAAKQVGAVNTLVRVTGGYKGYNTDVYGLHASMQAAGIEYCDKNVAIIGSGGAAYAAVVCVMNKARSIHILNRTKANAVKLKTHMTPYTNTPITVYGLEQVVDEKIDIIIQTTGVGMGQFIGQIPQGTEALLGDVEGVVDMIYNPWETAFIKAAKERGINAINGFDMLYYQAIKAYQYMHDKTFRAQEIEQIKEIIYQRL